MKPLSTVESDIIPTFTENYEATTVVPGSVYSGTMELPIKKEPEEYDDVEKPSHYCEGRMYEPDLVARDWGFTNSAYMYNALKYMSRAGRKVYDDLDEKQSCIKDLKKAVWELNRRIEELEEE